LPVEQVAVWYLFSTYIGFQGLADLGLNASFVRAYGYALGGASEIKKKFELQDLKENIGEPNWELVERIDSTIKKVYLSFSLILFLILTIIGTITLKIPINKMVFQSDGWIAWGVIVVITSVNLYGQRFQIYLMGLNNVALFMRWQTLFSTLTTVTAIITLFLSDSLLYLVIAVEIWVIFAVIRNRMLARKVYDEKFKAFRDMGFDKNVFSGVFPSGWRTWIAQMMSYGLIQFSGIFYAQIGDTQSVATYLFSLRVMNVIKSFSLAPFYSKLPRLNKLFTENKISLVLKTASKGMFISHLSFVLPFIAVGLFMPPFLHLIHSHVNFATPVFWSVLGVAYWTERFGGMHLQFYSLCNDVKGHIAGAVAGAIYVCFSALFYKTFGVYAFPLGLVLGNILFLMPYSAKCSYSLFKIKLWSFEKNASMPAFIILIVYIGFQYFIFGR